MAMISRYPESGDAPFWIDLLDPTPEEADEATRLSGLRTPTRDQVSEIESTSRIFEENQALYLSTALVSQVDTPDLKMTPVGFVLGDKTLVTVRFDPLKAFDTARESLKSQPCTSPGDVFLRIVETVIDRAADRLERAAADLDAISHNTFRAEDAIGKKKDRKDHPNDRLRSSLLKLGAIADRVSKIRDSLLGLGRLAGFVAEMREGRLSPSLNQRLGAVRADIGSLNDYEGHLTGKVQFLLDATLGFISIEQNDTVKILTVVSVVGVPPVLVAGVYGMNFKVMPELTWAWGYPYSIGLMVVTAILPLIWFKRRGWL